MGSSENLKYEFFIRKAFGINNGRMVDRCGDPANLANTDVLDASYTNPEYFNKAKVAVAYSIAIYNSYIYENNTEAIADNEYTIMQDYLRDALSANDSNDLIRIIDCYKTHFKDYLG